jgi:hypothetical protein
MDVMPGGVHGFARMPAPPCSARDAIATFVDAIERMLNRE